MGAGGLRLEPVLLLRREAGCGVCGGDAADLEEPADALRDDAGELGADVGRREPAFELGLLLLEHAEVGLGLVVGLFCAFRVVVGIEDRLLEGLGVEVGELGRREVGARV